MSQLFEPVINHDSMQHAPMGQRTSAGRYKMPTLPGEEGPKSGGDWVSGGLQSMTNLASSISDTKALGEWDRQQTLIGIALNRDLRRDLCGTVWATGTEVDFQNLRAHPELRAALDALAERAKDIGGANTARDAGIYGHTIWEVRNKTGELTGDAETNYQITELEKLLDRAGLEVIPDLTERTVRNIEIEAAGRLDNILLERRTGRLLMGDLKRKAKPFWGWLEMDAQLAGYAYSEWMLTPDGEAYEDGPRRLGVDLTEGVILHMPSRPDAEGNWAPALRRVDLIEGWRTLQLARQVCTQRSRGKSAARRDDSFWPVDN